MLLSISFFILITASGIYIAFFTGQGGSRLSMGTESINKSQTRNDDKFWKFGVFYTNKNDPSIFVEKRFGIGYTFNFGNLWVVFIVIGILIYSIISLIIF